MQIIELIVSVHNEMIEFDFQFFICHLELVDFSAQMVSIHDFNLQKAFQVPFLLGQFIIAFLKNHNRMDQWE